jgi:hypothetical protein
MIEEVSLCYLAGGLKPGGESGVKSFSIWATKSEQTHNNRESKVAIYKHNYHILNHLGRQCEGSLHWTMLR